MILSEAKEYVGKVCSIRWRDRLGKEQVAVSKIYDATYVPLYGGYLITDTDDISLDRISAVSLVDAPVETTVVSVEAQKIAA